MKSMSMLRVVVASTLVVAVAGVVFVFPAGVVQANGMPPIERYEPMSRSYEFTGMDEHDDSVFLLVIRQEARSARYERDAQPAFAAHPLAGLERWRPAAHPVGVDVSYTVYAVPGELPEDDEALTEEWLAEQESTLSLDAAGKFPHVGDRGRLGHSQTMTYRVHIQQGAEGEKALQLQLVRGAVYNANGDLMHERRLDENEKGNHTRKHDEQIHKPISKANGNAALLLTLLSALAGLLLLGLARSNAK